MRHRPFSQYLQVRSASGVTFSADGKTIAFLTDITGVPQVWSVPVAGGWPHQRTFSAERVASAHHAPVGDRLLFEMDTGGDERLQLYVLEEDGTRLTPITDAPGVIHQFGGWSPDGRRIVYAGNARQSAYFDLYTRDLAEDQPVRIMEYDGMSQAGPWSPDGSAVLATLVLTTMHHQIFSVNMESGAQHSLTDPAREARYIEPCWAADGSAIYVLSDRERDTLALARMSVADGTLQWLRAGEWDFTHLTISADGRHLALVENVDGYSTLHVLEAESQREVPLAALPAGVILDLTWAPNGDALAVSMAGGARNADVWLVPLNDAARRITQSTLAGIPRASLVEPALVRYPTFDGRHIPAFWFQPPGADAGAPVVVYVHGGPESQFVPGFNPVIQYLVHRGSAVLAPNVRGSTGYGKAYSRLDDVELRMDSVADLAATVGWLREHAGGEDRRVAVMGGSYGGFMTLSAITTYPDLWAAAISIVGIANFVTFLEQTGPWRRKLRECEYGSLEHDRAFLERISPIHHSDQITAPLMVIHGANDPRVPVGEAEQMVHALRARGQSVEYLRFEDEGHGLVKLPNRVRAYTAVAEFLDRTMRAGSSA
ncbi:MAG: S9 family peptidase [Chloroflexota bacterium]